MAKRELKDYAVEKAIETIKVVESLEGTNFEPISIEEIICRVGVLRNSKDRADYLKRDAVWRILVSLELCGWAKNVNGKWMLGAAALKLSSKYADICLQAVAKN